MDLYGLTSEILVEILVAFLDDMISPSSNLPREHPNLVLVALGLRGMWPMMWFLELLALEISIGGTSEGSFLRFEDIKSRIQEWCGKGNSESLSCNFENIVNLMLICIEK